MVNFLRYCCINCLLIWCIFWIFWPAEAKTVTQAAGSRVTLYCPDSVQNINMANWNFNGEGLITFNRARNQTTFNKSVHLNLEMSALQSERYALIIKDAQKSQEGNYTCTVSSPTSGVFDEFWELIITEEKRSTNILNIVVIAAVPSFCFLILICALVILKQRKKNKSPSEIRQQKQVEDIYENHLEIQRRQAYLNKP